MLRVLALLCSLALMQAPMGPALAQSGCAMVVAGAHATHGADQQMPATSHPAQACKQLCAVVAILIPPEAVPVPVITVQPALPRVARLIELACPGPHDHPPKGLL